jgi:non-specific serine/threonine protein kinase
VRELENTTAIGYVLYKLGILSDMQGHYDRARSYYKEAFEIDQRRGNEFRAAWRLNGLGRVAFHQHHWHEARTHFTESLALFQKRDDKSGIAACLIGLASLTGAQGQTEQAAQLLGTIEKLLPEIAKAPFERDIGVQVEYERTMAAVRSALGEEVFAAAQAKGREMTPEQAIRFALEDPHEDEGSITKIVLTK